MGVKGRNKEIITYIFPELSKGNDEPSSESMLEDIRWIRMGSASGLSLLLENRKRQIICKPWASLCRMVKLLIPAWMPLIKNPFCQYSFPTNYELEASIGQQIKISDENYRVIREIMVNNI